MISGSLIEIFSVFLLATVKFQWAVVMAIGLGINSTWSFIASMAGGIVGVLAFIFLGELIRKLYYKMFPGKIKKDIMEANSRGFRKWVVDKGGLAGIAFLTPFIFTIPVGTLLSVALGFSWQRILIAMTVSFAFWAIFILGLYEISGIKLDAWLKGLFA